MPCQLRRLKETKVHAPRFFFAPDAHLSSDRKTDIPRCPINTKFNDRLEGWHKQNEYFAVRLTPPLRSAFREFFGGVFYVNVRKAHLRKSYLVGLPEVGLSESGSQEVPPQLSCIIYTVFALLNDFRAAIMIKLPKLREGVGGWEMS